MIGAEAGQDGGADLRCGRRMAVRRGGTAMTAALILAGQVYLWAGAAVAALFLT